MQSSEKKRNKNKNDGAIKAADGLIKQKKGEIAKLEKEIQKLKKDIDNSTKNYEEIQKKIKTLEGNLNEFLSESSEEGIDDLESLREIKGLKSTNQTTKSPKKEKSKTPLKPPNELLPKEVSGILYLHKKKRYFAITYYNQIDNGKEEASRLNAKLVVDTKWWGKGIWENHLIPIMNQLI